MKWYEFSQDNGDGSFSKRRYRTREEAKEALEFFESLSWWVGDGDGVDEVDTQSEFFFNDLEEDKLDYSEEN